MPKDFDQTEHLKVWNSEVLHWVHKNAEKLLEKGRLKLKHYKVCNIPPSKLLSVLADA
jgi:hypothetical protein